MTGRAAARLAPGDLVVGRHRLLREVARGPGSALWQAEDEVLARSVAVRVLTGDGLDADADAGSREEAFLAAALRAGRVSDPRVARVYDAGDDHGVPVVVREWVEGRSLGAVLRDGPLPAPQVARVGMEIAAALSAAHAHDVGHGALHPGDVVLTSGGVKLTDLEIAAALEGRPVPLDAATRCARDVLALGAVLYAASTGCWPHGSGHGLPGPPQTEGRRCTPHQVRAAVPRSLDSLITDALEGRYPTPAAVAAHLAPLAGPAPREPATASHAPVAGPGGAPRGTVGAGDPWAGSRWRNSAALLLVLAMVAAVGWTAGLVTDGQGEPVAASGSPGSVAPTPGATVLRPVSVADFDPPPGDGAERPTEVRLTVDGNPDTAWTTDTYYNRPDLGGLKAGVGILLDLGEPATLRQVRLALETGGGRVQVRAGAERPGVATDLPLLTTLVDPPAVVEEQVGPVDGVQFVLLWFTELPPRGIGYGVGVREVTLTGER